LLTQHADLREVGFIPTADPGVLPVLAERDLLTRLLLALMVSVGLEAAWRGCRKVRIGYRGDASRVTVRVACDRDGGRPGDPDPTVRRLDALGAAGTATGMGGELVAVPRDGGEMAYELTLPTLPMARRRAAPE